MMEACSGAAGHVCVCDGAPGVVHHRLPQLPGVPQPRQGTSALCRAHRAHRSGTRAHWALHQLIASCQQQSTTEQRQHCPASRKFVVRCMSAMRTDCLIWVRSLMLALPSEHAAAEVAAAEPMTRGIPLPASSQTTSLVGQAHSRRESEGSMSSANRIEIEGISR